MSYSTESVEIIEKNMKTTPKQSNQKNFVLSVPPMGHGRFATVKIDGRCLSFSKLAFEYLGEPRYVEIWKDRNKIKIIKTSDTKMSYLVSSSKFTHSITSVNFRKFQQGKYLSKGKGIFKLIN